MIGRIVASTGLTVLAACKPAPEAPVPEKAEGAEHIACAVAGGKDFRKACAVERAPQGDRLFLVVRHPDGGFRRFEVLDDGRGLAVSDGATQAITRYADGMAELAVDQDRYRFPITLKKPDQAKGDAGAQQQAR